jgi:4-amino-4-deoxy-L-arabinose transferase-like glycosyltransferase
MGSVSRSAPADGSAAEAQASPSVIQVLLEIGALVILAAILFFFHLGSYGLWEPDEARYAEIAREMLATHHFIIPHLNFVPYLEKPPLLYWMTAVSLKVFGVNEFAARLANARLAMLGVLATYLFGLKVFDRRRALLAGAILATSPLYSVMAQVLTTDMALAVFVTLALFGLFLHRSEGKSWRWLFYSSMALAVMTKGPIGILVPSLVALIFLWIRGLTIEELRKLRPLAGLALVMAVAAPWFIAVALMMPGFVEFYFVGEHFRRFFEASYSHGGPFYYYVPVVLCGTLPWALAVPFVRWRETSSGNRDGANQARNFCLVSAAVIFIFFSVAGSKLISYMLPAIPVLSLVLSDIIVTQIETDSRRLIYPAALFAILGATLVSVGMVAHISSEYFTLTRQMIVVAGAIASAGGIVATILLVRSKPMLAIVIIAASAAGMLLTASFGRLAVEPLRSYAALSREVARRAPTGRLVCYHRYVQALPFYTHRRVILVGPWLSELSFGAAHSPDSAEYFLSSDADLQKLWTAERSAVLVIDQPDLDRLSGTLGPLRLIASEGKKRAVTKADE